MAVLLTAGWLLSGRLVESVSPLVVSAVRTLSTFPVLTALVLFRPRYRAAARTALRRPLGLVVLAGLGFFLYYVCTMVSISKIGSPASSILVGLLPCLTLVIGVLAFRERSTTAKWLGSTLAVTASVTYGLSHGVPVGLVQAGTGSVLVGVGLALLGTVAYALYGFVYRKVMGDLPSLASLPGITGVATVMLAPVVLLTVDDLRIDTGQLLGLVFLGAVFTAPVFLISHELVLLRGPLFTTSVAVCVPFLIRVAQWSLGMAPALDGWELALFTLAAAGVLLTVRSGGRE